MSVDRDPFDILGSNDPVDPDTIPRPDSPQAETLFERVITAPVAPAPRLRSTRRWVIAIAAAAALALIAAATWLALTRDVTAPAVVCYAAEDLNSDRVGILATEAPDPQLCTQAWSDGTLTNPTVPPDAVPPLTECVTDIGLLAVFPTGDPTVCERLGLATPSAPPPTSDLASFAAARDQLIAYMLSQPCIDIDTAQEQVRAILDAYQLSGWTIQPQQATPQRPCASLAFDTTTHTIHLVPIPRQG